MIKNNQLNPLIFDENNNLRPQIRNKIIDIVEEFISTILDKEPSINFPIYDILIVGSNSGYNYTEDSDLDVHIVSDYQIICDCPSIVSELFNAERSLFNRNYNISLKGIDVEIYVEDIKTTTVSNGIYSVMSDSWIKFPENTELEELSDNDPELLSYINKCHEILNSDYCPEVESFLSELYLLRKYSLACYGENGQGNLIYKRLRSLGLIDSLKNLSYELRSRELSLENYKRIIQNRR